MDYRTHLKYLMTRGQAVKIKGQGIVGNGRGEGIPKTASEYRSYIGAGTISHRAVVDRAIDSMNNLNISGSGARKKDYGISGQGKPKAKKSKGSGNFKSLKFNF